MGRIFIENEHNQKYYYCKNCENYDIEIAPSNKCTSIECSYNVFFDISFNNINIDLHPNNENKFVLLDIDPVMKGGIGKYFYCK